jgi:DNA-binding NarL/FixJ family response regulator
MLERISESAYRERQLQHFHALDHVQQRQAIQRLAAAGHADSTIAQATGLSVEMVRRILSEVVS